MKISNSIFLVFVLKRVAWGLYNQRSVLPKVGSDTIEKIPIYYPLSIVEHNVSLKVRLSPFQGLKKVSKSTFNSLWIAHSLIRQES